MSPQLPLSLDPCTHDSWSSGDLTLSTLFPDLSSISDSGGSFLSPGADGRTTLMLRRVPRRYTLDLLRLELDSLPELQGSYDLLYLPMDSARVTNKGYAFINLKNQSQVCYVYMMLDGYVWKSFNSVNKRCKVCFAHIQGRESTSAYIQSKRLLQHSTTLMRGISNSDSGAIFSIPNIFDSSFTQAGDEEVHADVSNAEAVSKDDKCLTGFDSSDTPLFSDSYLLHNNHMHFKSSLAGTTADINGLSSGFVDQLSLALIEMIILSSEKRGENRVDVDKLADC